MPVPSTPQDLITLIREKLYDNTSGIIEEDTLRNVLENIINVLDAKFSFFSPTLTEEQYSQWNLMLDYMLRETKGVLTISSTAPTGTTAIGKYLLSGAGTFTNLGGLVTTADKLNYAYFDGTTWSKVEVDMPTPSTVFDKTNNISSGTMKAINEWFSTIEVIQVATEEITNRRTGGYINDTASFVTMAGYTTTDIVDVTNVYKVRIENFNPPTSDYAIKFYDSNNTLILNQRQTGTYDLIKPNNATKFQVGYKNFAASTNFKVFKTIQSGTSDKGTSSSITSGADAYKPVNSVAVESFVNSEITSLQENIQKENLYKINVKDVVYNIDLFSGTDDQKIDKALSMINNVGGGQIYFPSRIINISKAILIPSNTKIILDNCQIQMNNNIHDNIFRAKGLQTNPSQYGGLCLSAEWTENFEIEGLGTPTLRSSVTPLHVGDAYGWRGCTMLFAKCRNYKVSNIKIIESHMWSISNEYCEDGEFYNITFDNSLHPNADGLNFRNGCRRMIARKLRGKTNDSAIATTCLDNTVPSTPASGYSYQALGFNYGDFFGAEDILVEDVQVSAKYGPALILASSPTIKRVTYKDIISTVSFAPNWVNVMLSCNAFRNFNYGTTYIDGNISDINIINCNTSIHEYAIGVYGGKIDNVLATGILNSNPSKLGLIENNTTTIISML